MSHLFRAIQWPFKLPRKFLHIWRSAPPGAIKRRLREAAKRKVKHGVSWAGMSITRPLDSLGLRGLADKVFWRLPMSAQNVFARIAQLENTAPERLPAFFATLVLRLRKPQLIAALSRSEKTQHHLRDALQTVVMQNRVEAWYKIRNSHRQVACVSIGVGLLLDAPEQKIWTDFLEEQAFVPNQNYQACLESASTLLCVEKQDDNLGWLPASHYRTRPRNRLVITSSQDFELEDALLCNGADEVTLYSFVDIYGKIDLTEFQDQIAIETIRVEHARSRISRFSGTYHQLHENTRQASEQLVGALCDTPEGRADFILDAKPYLELSFADELFFAALKREALETLLASDEFDHIVIALDKTASGDALIRNLLTCKNFATDPRIELTFPKDGLSNGMPPSNWLEQRNRSTSNGTRLLHPSSLKKLDDNLLRKVQGYAKANATWDARGKKRAFLAASSISAYNSSTKVFFEILDQAYSLRATLVSGNLLNLFGSTKDIPSAQDVFLHPPRSLDLLRGIYAQETTERIRQHRHLIQQPELQSLLDIDLSQLVWKGLTRPLYQYAFYHAWLAQLQSKDMLPDVIVQTPFRTPLVAAFAGLARRYGIPSIALEPHGLNAEYCRYSKITSDYYGVVSRYFIGAAEEGFGVPGDYSIPVGSPRLIAPVTYDRDARRVDARKRYVKTLSPELQNSKIVTFFSQPALWEPLEEVWRVICTAAKENDVQLCLKMHPEEGKSLRRKYEEIAQDIGIGDRLTVLDGDATQALEASDLVLSRYSATIFEAALLRKPAFCVTKGDENYPLHQHEIIGAPFFRDAQTLSEGIKSFFADPAPYYAQMDQFLSEEPQLFSGPKPPLLELVETAIQTHKSGQFDTSKRNAPTTLFLDGPHTVYQI